MKSYATGFARCWRRNPDGGWLAKLPMVKRQLRGFSQRIPMDISMPVVDGLQATRKILASGSRTKILMLSIYDSQDVLAQVVDSGARGFVLKSDAARDLVAAVEAIRTNGTFFTPKTAEIILNRRLDRMQEQKDRSPMGKKGHARH
jgi:DNA-binding NarL/FixJ family response regulator